MWAGKRVGSHEKRSVWREKGAGKQASRKWGIGAGRGGKKKDKRQKEILPGSMSSMADKQVLDALGDRRGEVKNLV